MERSILHHQEKEKDKGDGITSSTPAASTTAIHVDTITEVVTTSHKTELAKNEETTLPEITKTTAVETLTSTMTPSSSSSTSEVNEQIISKFEKLLGEHRSEIQKVEQENQR